MKRVLKRVGLPARRDNQRGAVMNVEELAGRAVWIKDGEFRSVPGEIKGVSDPPDDSQSSIDQTTFSIELASGDVRDVLGSNISQIADCEAKADVAT
jgi:hypothetical protein